MDVAWKLLSVSAHVTMSTHADCTACSTILSIVLLQGQQFPQNSTQQFLLIHSS